MQSHHKVVVTPDQETTTGGTYKRSFLQNICLHYTSIFFLLLYYFFQGLTKWKCEVCTYENWPASIRCAMCQAANCNKVRAENHNNRSKAVATSSSTDIFKMGATSLSRSTSPQLVTQLTEECKWACKYSAISRKKKLYEFWNILTIFSAQNFSCLILR